jgi:SAM-dependent methyltransferase
MSFSQYLINQMERAHADGTKFIVDQIDASPKSRLVVLDLGCGTGWAFDKILNGYKKTNVYSGFSGCEKALEYYGVDIEDKKMEIKNKVFEKIFPVYNRVISIVAIKK